MEYESDILKRLIKTYGVVGNPRYISEIIKEFIVQGKERFPELFTYQADWLAHIDVFGLNPSYTVSYTGQSFYAPNTLERPVKSAILKGQTLANIIDKPYNVSPEDNRHRAKEFTFKFIKRNTDYFIVYDVTTDLSPIAMGFLKDNGNWSKNIEKISTNKGILKLNSGDYPNYFRIIGAVNASYLTVNSIMVIEYQQGMENWDIPYFEGMQSVKMPVLTTSNEDGTKTNILTINEDVTLRSNESVYDELDLLTGKLTQRIDENGEVLSREIVKTVDLTILDQNGQNVKHLMSFNGGTHFTTSSQDGSLLPMLTVDVVTDLEEILMVCSSEGNTM